MWKSADTVSGSNAITLLWQDATMTPWEPKTAYRWHLKWRPSAGVARFRLYRGSKLMTDSVDVHNTQIAGGKVGVLAFNESSVIWSALDVRCASRLNQAMYFDGTDDSVTVGNVTYLDIKGR